MRKRWLGAGVTGVLLCGALLARAPADHDRHGFALHFVPDDQAFWDFSKNWTTNYGPAYRDTVPGPTYFVPCTGPFALCFQSGPPPLPCVMDGEGRFARCECTVGDGLNHVLITGILNHSVYEETLRACGDDGSGCRVPDSAPVCKYLRDGRLIPGADVISDFDPAARDGLVTPERPFTPCDGPFAGCMTAPCKRLPNGNAECDCPVFWGHFQLVGEAECTLRGRLVPSASYTPALDPNPTP